MATFQKAERRQHKPKIALTGPSGSGKTFSALLIAAGMGKRIAVIDTENGSASLYADMDKGELKGVKFDVLEINPPYTIDKYAKAIEAAQAEGYDVLVCDSISHAWAGEGGLLSKKEALDQRGGNSYTNWAGITKEHELFKARILNADIIMIATMRSKQDYILETNANGKSAPKKVGMAPIQRDGMEYEFTTVLDLAMDHNAAASKDRTGLFDGQIFKPTKKTGKQIMDWLAGAKPVEATKPAAAPVPASAATATKPKAEPPADEHDAPMSQDQAAEMARLIQAIKGPRRSEDTIWKGVRKEVGHDFADTAELTEAEAAKIIDYLGRWLSHVQPEPPSTAAEAGI